MDLVRLNLWDVTTVRQAVVDMQQNAGGQLEGLLIQPQIEGQRESMVGLFCDPRFGPVVAFGLGGVLAEALDDVAMAVASLTEADALEMLGRLRKRDSGSVSSRRRNLNQRLAQAFRGFEFCLQQRYGAKRLF